ncbi:protein CBFA2T1 [Octopus bimaculoides]|uniref:TAFH domain-containing protein n=1 Tax=Octopus bimaculoides TaxID=37653 RepID=A0A0L8G115_OCTBM|nr:protein CBFA2T1 [Octopus bimaculoides]
MITIFDDNNVFVLYIPGMNGTHSPLGLNGRTPSPPGSMPNSVSTQQLPPACGARQLSKLKRFLTTLQQFGSDISPDIGERVRTLVLGLVNSHLSIEEFHAKLQEATNFPLRPFVIPFLKANLPLLQRELLHCARMAKQTPQQYLAQNEHILFDTSNSPVESHDSLSSEFNENGKRRSPDRPTKENGSDSHMDTLHSAKRHPSMSPLGNNRISPNGMVNLNSGGPIRLGDISLSRELRERERLEQERIERERAERDRERDRDRHYPSYSFSRNDPFDPPFDRLDDNWKHVETMLHCIIGMVNKTKRALAVLQERSIRDREELSLWMRRHAEEEAVSEVKRQAMLELQKAVAAVEQKANELVASERQKMDRALSEARKQAHDELLSTINHQEESSEVG